MTLKTKAEAQMTTGMGRLWRCTIQGHTKVRWA